MQIVIDISKDKYDEIMSMDWVNGRRFFDEELRAIHDGKALEQEPCGDVVSRQAVIDTLTKTSGIRGDALKALYDLPSVTPQQKMGRWIMSDDGLYRPICNNCGAHPWKGYIPTVEEATEAFKYCPNCGANMSENPTVAEGSKE